jgi:hypothetical protein
MNAALDLLERPRDLDSFADIERAHMAEIERLGRALDEAEACSSMWLAVIDRAVADLRWLQRNEGRRLNRHRKGTRNAIMESDPHEFFVGPTFDAVCQLLGVEPDAVLRGYGVQRPLPDEGEAA